MADGSEPNDLNDRTRTVLAATLGLDVADIFDDASSDTLEGWDSLAHQNLLLALSRAFAVTFSAEEGDGLQDLASIEACIAGKLGATKPVTVSIAVTAPRVDLDLPPPVVVLSDSNARTFAYNAAFLPLGIGQGVKTNLLTPENAKYVEEKIAFVLAKVRADAPVLLALHGTYMHHFRNSYGTRSGDVARDGKFLNDCAVATVALAAKVAKGSGRKIAIAAVPPLDVAGYGTGAALYNAALGKACAQHNIAFVDVAEDVTDANGKVKAAYWGDSWHLNAKAGDLYAMRLMERGLVSSAREGALRWSYHYLAPVLDTVIEIWGDFARDDLILDRPDGDFDLSAGGATHSQTFKWERHHFHSNFIEDCSASITPVFQAWQQEQKKPVTVCVLDCREGFVPLQWSVPGTTAVRGIDRNAVRIARANEIKALFDKSDVTFETVPRYGDLGSPSDVVIALERTGYADPYLASLFMKVRSLSRAFFFLSDAGASHMRLLGNAGFAKVYEFPIVHKNGPLQMPWSRQTANGRWNEAQGYRLLAAFAEAPGAGFQKAMTDYVASVRQSQERRAAADLAALLDPMIVALKT